MPNGVFITLEGPEGAGKSTQAAALADWLRKLRLDVVLTREPGEGRIGKQIRGILADPASAALSPGAEALLLAADRAQHVAEFLHPALNAGKIVICDRYVDSFIAYQGYGRGMDINWLEQLNQVSSGGLMPDLTLLLLLEPEQGLARTRRRGAADRWEREELSFHRRVLAGYRQIARKNNWRVCKIEADAAPQQVQEQAREAVLELLHRKGVLG